MGTNYYWHYRTKPRPETYPPYIDSLHIGKSSGGWCFSLHIYPQWGIHNLKDWAFLIRSREFLPRSQALIYDEYDRIVEPLQMWETITMRSWEQRKPDGKFGSGRQLLRDRQTAVQGPNGLMRHVIDGTHCVGHGEGTWDYFVGEFS